MSLTNFTGAEINQGKSVKSIWGVRRGRVRNEGEL